VIIAFYPYPLYVRRDYPVSVPVVFLFPRPIREDLALPELVRLGTAAKGAPMGRRGSRSRVVGRLALCELVTLELLAQLYLLDLAGSGLRELVHELVSVGEPELGKVALQMLLQLFGRDLLPLFQSHDC
jgi:hypothetical protein